MGELLGRRRRGRRRRRPPAPHIYSTGDQNGSCSSISRFSSDQNGLFSNISRFSGTHNGSFSSMSRIPGFHSEQISLIINLGIETYDDNKYDAPELRFLRILVLI